MRYIVFRNLERRRLLKDLEEEYIHEKRRKYDNEATENDFVRSWLVSTTATITKLPEQLESCCRAESITTGLIIILKRK